MYLGGGDAVNGGIERAGSKHECVIFFNVISVKTKNPKPL